MPALRRLVSPVVVAALSLLLAACSSVISDQPLGNAPDPQGAQALEGVWKAEEGKVRFTPGADGHITVSILPAKPGHSAPPPFDVELRHSGDLHYVSLHNPDEPEEQGYLFLRYQTDADGNIVAWLPSVTALRHAIADGHLAGSVEGSRASRTVRITATQAEIDAFLASVPEATIWEMDNPIMIRKPDAAGATQ